MKLDIDLLSNDDLWSLYSIVIKKLKTLGLIKTNNIIGERGEQLALKIYNNTKGLVNLQLAPAGTKNVDAISRNGERYAIKTIKLPNKTTGVFYGFGTKENIIKEKKFEYLILVILNDSIVLEKIYEIEWEKFLQLIKWHSRMNAFNITLTKNVIINSKVIYEIKK